MEHDKNCPCPGCYEAKHPEVTVADGELWLTGYYRPSQTECD